MPVADLPTPAPLSARFLSMFFGNFVGAIKHHVVHGVLLVMAALYNGFRVGFSWEAWKEHVTELWVPVFWALCIAIIWHSVSAAHKLIRRIQGESSSAVLETDGSLILPHGGRSRIIQLAPNAPPWFRAKISSCAGVLIIVSIVASVLAWETIKVPVPSPPPLHLSAKLIIEAVDGPSLSFRVCIENIRDLRLDNIKVMYKSPGTILSETPTYPTERTLAPHGKLSFAGIPHNTFAEDLQVSLDVVCQQERETFTSSFHFSLIKNELAGTLDPDNYQEHQGDNMTPQTISEIAELFSEEAGTIFIQVEGYPKGLVGGNKRRKLWFDATTNLLHFYTVLAGGKHLHLQEPVLPPSNGVGTRTIIISWDKEKANLLIK